MVRWIDQSKIGSGGFGEVWTSQREGQGPLFAKKVLQATPDASAVRRFSREVRILSTLDHPNIVRVIAKRLESAPYFYIMPLYRHSLRLELSRLVRDESRIFPIFKAMLDGIEYAHEQGIIHRDLKPENVLMNSDAEVVVSDFGLGRIIDSESTRETQTGWGLGTPLYMAPEQLLDAKNSDERSDIFSLGRILYELYTGPLTSAVQDTSSISTAMALIIQRCTHSDPGKRFQSVSELKQSWLSLYDAANEESDRGEIKKLVAELSSAESPGEEGMRRLLSLLIRYENDSDLLHEAIVGLSSNVIAGIYSLQPESVRRLIERFSVDAASQGWPFNYTDKIASACWALFELITDIQVRAPLVEAMLLIGVRHNRWYVLGTFRRMLGAVQDRRDAFVLAERLRTTDDDIRHEAVSYVGNDVLPIIRQLFEVGSAS